VQAIEPTFDFEHDEPADVAAHEDAAAAAAAAERDLRDLDVHFETVEVREEYLELDEDFTIIDTTELLKNIEVVAEEVLADPFADLAFELPLVVNNDMNDAEEQARTIVFDLNDDLQPSSNPSLSSEAPPSAPKIKTISAYELDFDDDFEQEMTLKTKEVVEVAPRTESPQLDPLASSTGSETVMANSPYEMSLSETQEILAARKEQRIKVFKEFNHQFNAKAAKIEDFENVPAYKRAGVSFDEIPSDAKVSRTTLSDDSSGNPQIRSNNSFLHDNVD
jgi:cell division protein FtsZ